MVRLGCAVAAGAADLLVIGFEAARQGGVDDGADVRLVDAHAEGDGGDHDLDAACEELAPARACGARHRGRRGRRRRGSGGSEFGGDGSWPARAWACRRSPGAAPRPASSSQGEVGARCEGATSTTSTARLSRRKPWMKRAGAREAELRGDIVLHDAAWRWP